MKATQSGDNVCLFTVAVNKRMKPDAGHPEADFFRIAAWRQLGENCNRYLGKGKKVCVIGSVTSRAYLAKDGTPRANMEVNAQEVEFLSPRTQATDPVDTAPMAKTDAGFVKVDDDSELPF